MAKSALEYPTYRVIEALAGGEESGDALVDLTIVPSREYIVPYACFGIGLAGRLRLDVPAARDVLAWMPGAPLVLRRPVPGMYTLPALRQHTSQLHFPMHRKHSNDAISASSMENQGYLLITFRL